MTRVTRNSGGVALVNVLVIGSISLIFLLGLAAIVTSAVRASAANKWSEGLRNCAEVGIDYTVDKFNSVYPCPLDPTSGSLTTILPDSELQAVQVNGVVPNAGIPNVVVSIKVSRLESAGDWVNLQALSSVYSPQLDPSKSTSNDWNNPASSNMTTASGGGFRVVESTASNGVFSRTVRVILKARFDSQPDGSRPLDPTLSTPQTTSYFQQPLFGNSNISLDGSFRIAGLGADSSGTMTPWHQVADPIAPYNAYNLNLATNRLATLKGSVQVTGDVAVTSKSSGANNVVIADPNVTVEGRVLANGNVDQNLTPYTDTPAGNVQARADSPDGIYDPGATRNGLNQNPITVPSSSSQYQLAAVPTPSTATTLNELSSYAATGTSPTDQGTTFQTTSFNTDNIASNQSVTFNNTSSPVRVFIDQGSSNSNAVDLDTGKISTTSSLSSNFQIWYEGNKNINVNLTKDFNGLIYAPNASINITGNGKYQGALVGKNINIALTSGSVVIDTDLSKSSSQGGAGSASGALSFSSRAGQGTVIQGWQPITWQEY